MQLEMAQRAYMDETRPQDCDATRAAPLRAILKTLVALLLAWRPAHGA
jgi:N-formylglutamate amidohydrolase